MRRMPEATEPSMDKYHIESSGPPIRIDVERLDPSLPTSSSEISFQPSNYDHSRLTVHHEFPSRLSLDGETLRPRSNSFTSSVATAVRSRAGSNAISEFGCDAYGDVPLPEALTPDARHEADFRVDDNKFAFSPGQLNKMLNPKSLAAFRALGGLDGLARGLRTDLTAGLSIDERILNGYVTFEQATSVPTSKEKGDVGSRITNITPMIMSDAGSQFADRARVFGRNRLPDRKRTSFFKLLWDAYNDKILILLTFAAVVSLSLGIYESLSGGSTVDWIEGVAICVAIVLVIIVTAANNWQKERQFLKLTKRNHDREIKAIRSGKSVMISVFDIRVGDVLHIEPGDSPPADGVLIFGHGVKCDESSATGESDQMKKYSGHEIWQSIMDGTATRKLDPYIISGSKVLEGVGTYLVTSVGPYSTYGRIMASLQIESGPTPLQVKLGKLANWIGYLGSSAAILLLSILLLRFFARLPGNYVSPAAKGERFMSILIVAVTVIVVAIPEGLPLAVTLALAYATTRMVKENNLVRVLHSCETMGNVTVICSDKTGTLTQNRMTVTAGAWGLSGSFSQPSIVNDDSTPVEIASEFTKQLSAVAKDLILKSIALNSTAFEEEKDGFNGFIGSKTEVALLQFAKDHLGMNLTEERANSEVAQLYPFDSAHKRMGVIYRESRNGYRLLAKGAPELILHASSRVVTELSGKLIATEELSQRLREAISHKIESYAQKSLRTIGMAYKDFPYWPPVLAKTSEDDSSVVKFDDVFQDMIWIGVVGIQDPLRPEVPAAIEKCGRAGVQVKMVTGDNLTTAVAIATSCGIKTHGIIMEGPEFRQLSKIELNRVVPDLQVLARSSPEDKRILVECLKNLGETVAVTGDGTNDGPALKSADVGFSMGIAGTEVAKEASSIILLDDNFKSIVTAIAWGRAVNDAIAKFLQFQITVNITAVCLTFVSAIYNTSGQGVLTAVQLLWINLIMDTFASLALATDAPSESVLDRQPTAKNAPLFTITMWKMIIGQAVYQLAVTLTLYFAGGRIFRYDLNDSHQQLELNTIIFNTFVWMQIFNEFNCRRLDNRLNIFEGVWHNYWFLAVNGVMIAGQIMIIFVGDVALSVTPLGSTQWAICIICAIFCLPWAVLLRLIPDKHFAVVFIFVADGVTFIFAPFRNTNTYIISSLSRAGRAVCSIMKRFSIHFIHQEQGMHTMTHQDKEAEDSKKVASESSTIIQRIALPPIAVTTRE